MTERHSVEVLREAIELQTAKARDYQNENTTVRQADYYKSGFKTILEIMEAKTLRMRSIVEAYEANGFSPNFESLEDSCKDIINYASFGVMYLRGKCDGQDPERDFLNRKRSRKADPDVNTYQNYYDYDYDYNMAPTAPTVKIDFGPVSSTDYETKQTYPDNMRERKVPRYDNNEPYVPEVTPTMVDKVGDRLNETLDQPF